DDDASLRLILAHGLVVPWAHRPGRDGPSQLGHRRRCEGTGLLPGRRGPNDLEDRSRGQPLAVQRRDRWALDGLGRRAPPSFLSKYPFKTRLVRLGGFASRLIRKGYAVDMVTKITYVSLARR